MNETNTPDVSQAVATLVHAIFPHVSMSDITSLIGAVFVIARVLRKAIPDSAQTGQLGQLLKHLALEINPALGATIQKPETPPIQTPENAQARHDSTLASLTTPKP